MEKEERDYYLDLSRKLSDKQIDPDTYISEYLNSSDPNIVLISFSYNKLQKQLKESVPPYERIQLASQFLDDPLLSEEALVTTLRIFENEMDDWDLYYNNLSLFIKNPDKDFRLNTYTYTKCAKYDKNPRYNIYGRIPQTTHQKIIGLIDYTLLNDDNIDVKEKAASLLIEYFRRGFFDNPIEEIHKRLKYNNEKEVDWVLMVAPTVLPKDKYLPEQIFNEFSTYSNQNIQMMLCEYLAFYAKQFLRSSKKAQEYLFNLLKREDISDFTFMEASFCAGKRFNSLNKDFCRAVASRLEDDNANIRGDAMYTAELLIEDAEFRKNHPYPPYI